MADAKEIFSFLILLTSVSTACTSAKGLAKVDRSLRMTFLVVSNFCGGVSAVSVSSSFDENTRDSDVIQRETSRLKEGGQILLSSSRRVLLLDDDEDKIKPKKAIHDLTTPITNPVTTPTTPVGFVTIPATNPATVLPTNTFTPSVTVPSTNPLSTPVTFPVTNPTPITVIPGGNLPGTLPSSPPNSGLVWCAAKPGVSDAALQIALDYACGIGGVDCSGIQQTGGCFNPDTLRDHASYAFNSYYQKNPSPTSCDFGGAAMLVTTNPIRCSNFATTPNTVPVTNPTIPVTNPTTVLPPPFLPVTTPVNYPPSVPYTSPLLNPLPPPSGTPVGSLPGTVPVSPGNAGQSWCVSKTDALDAALQSGLDYACGIGGVDCSAIKQTGNCYNPNTLRDHASYAFNSYYQKNPSPASCDFGGTATLVNVNPSSGTCVYQASSSSSSVLNSGALPGGGGAGGSTTVFGSNTPISSSTPPVSSESPSITTTSNLLSLSAASAVMLVLTATLFHLR